MYLDEHGSVLRRRPRERRRHGAGHELVPGRGRHGRLLRPVRAGGQPRNSPTPTSRSTLPAARRHRRYTKTYACRRNSRLNIWVDLETPDGTTGQPLADTAVSTTLRSTNGVPIIVERAMWWPADRRPGTRPTTPPGATATGTAWALAEGEVGGAARTDTYILIANTSAYAGEARVTLVLRGRHHRGADVCARGEQPHNVPVGLRVPGSRRPAFRRGRREPRWHARAARGRARHVLERGRRELGAGTNALGTRLR